MGVSAVAKSFLREAHLVGASTGSGASDFNDLPGRTAVGKNRQLQKKGEIYPRRGWCFRLIFKVRAAPLPLPVKNGEREGDPRRRALRRPLSG